ncbi:Tm-1-like ATP-binding domain-containing protein [Paenibacillus silviterrae]|uniref:Tm-1-like ATP-binding domain-containing protein n=1 Tax=Paenibacillus silviterrae TaxID=3242194 RepID=UPI002542FDA0|nr:Tm-1-like ATP-binding domain-containing protein [Paenibacillus chinjuensis]
MGSTIGVIGAMDTKGPEFEYVKQQIEARGHRTLVIDTGVIDEPQLKPDVGRDRVAASGGTPIEELVKRRDRGEAMTVMAAGAAAVVRELYEAGAIQGIIGMGGTAGTTVASSAMRALPIGFPKVIVSTVASGDTSGYVGTKDILLFPAIVDVSGVNRISRAVFTRASGAVCGMVESTVASGADKPMIAASMFGNTTACVERARTSLETNGYEVLVFHCTGTGGRTLDSLTEGGYINGILDITTTEWADEIAGGVFAAGPERGDGAAARGIPQVIVPGCVDMVNFHARSTVPQRYADRNLYEWNPNVTLMRTTEEENAVIGRILADKANASSGPVAFLIPLQGVSILDSPGQPFWNPEADRACFDAIKRYVKPEILVYELDCNINAPEFADKAVQLLLSMLTQTK